MNSSESVAGMTTPENNLVTQGVLSDHVREIMLQIIVFVRLPLSAMGVVTNIFNIRVFIKQGVRSDNTNIGFISLSFFDLICSLTLMPYSLCYVASYAQDLGQHRTCITFAVQFIHAYFICQLSSAWTTVYMSLVKSLCVVIPLKVKLLFTPNVTLIVIISIFIFFAGDTILYASNTEVVWKFDPLWNKSIALMTDSTLGQNILYYNIILTNQVLPAVAMIIVTITTSLMVHKLLEVKKWRLKNANGLGQESEKKPLALKDIELVKSVTTITLIFLVCQLMSYIPGVAMVLLPGVSHAGINSNLLRVVFQFRFLFDAINASINFLFYIRISSRYKAAFSSSFPMCSSKDVPYK